MTVPEAENSTSRAASTPSRVATIFTVAVDPTASAIWEATVRFQISS